MSRRRALALGVLALALVACTGGGGDEGDGGAGLATGASGASGPAGSTPPAVPGLEEAVTLTSPPTEGAGEVPSFAWDAVPDAATYRLVVLGPGGEAIWAWEGRATSVNLGGLPGQRPVGEPGPVIEPGSSWSVAALDREGHVVALSPGRLVSP